MKMPVPMRKKKRTSVMRTKERSRRMPGSQVSRAIERHRAPLPRHPGRPVVDEPEGQEGQAELEEPDAEEGQAPGFEAGPGGHDGEAGDEADRAHDPDQPAGDADLLLRHEVRHEALVWALGEVGAELQAQEEQGVEDQRLGRAQGLPVPAARLGHGEEREAADEDEVEGGPRDDVALALAEPRRRVVAQRADGGHGEDGHDAAEQLERTHDGSHRGLAHDELELLLAEALVGAPDGVDAEPVDGDEAQLRPRQQDGRSARGGFSGERHGRALHAVDAHSGPTALRMQGLAERALEGGRLADPGPGSCRPGSERTGPAPSGHAR